MLLTNKIQVKDLDIMQKNYQQMACYKAGKSNVKSKCPMYAFQ